MKKRTSKSDRAASAKFAKTRKAGAKTSSRLPLKAKELKEVAGETHDIVSSGRHTALYAVDTVMLATYWHVGQAIVSREQQAKLDNKSVRTLLLELSKALTTELGKGFSRSQLTYMRLFFLKYRDAQTLSGQLAYQNCKVGVTVSHQQAGLRKDAGVTPSHQLSWPHFCELLKIDDDSERLFYEQECRAAAWSVRELRRQRESALYERLALSKDKKGVVRLAKKGQIVEDDTDIIKNPYVLEFLGIPEQHRYTEKQLENRVRRILEQEDTENECA